MILAALDMIKDVKQKSKLEEFYTANQKLFYSIAFSKLHNKHDSEDAVQQAFLEIVKKSDNFFGIEDSKKVGYVAAIVRNAAIKIWNKKNHSALNESELDIKLDEVVDEKVLPLDTRIISKLSLNDAIDFIDSLSEETKQTLYLKARFKMTYSQIAEELGCSESAVKKRISRAEKAIREFMDGKNNE